MRESVVLVPGVGFAGAELIPLALRLSRRGYASSVFWHWTGGPALTESARLLHRKASSLRGETVHFVGHSIGGLVILRMLADRSWGRPGRILTMGTPHAGLAAARLASGLPGARRLLGHGVRTAADGYPIPILGNREIGTLAGDRNLFFGTVLAPGQESDSLIGVAETRHPAGVSHRTVPETHAGMLYSRRVADLVEHFLRHGTFPADAPTGPPVGTLARPPAQPHRAKSSAR